MGTDLVEKILTEEGIWALRLMFDSAALVLIWLVQLVIYPSFLYMRRHDFMAWHPVYTRKVTWVVMPVMLGQLLVYGFMVFAHPSTDVWVNAALVAIAWLITFVFAVPLHMNMEESEKPKEASAKLVEMNWYRTVIWTIVFLVSVWVRFVG
ncbi:MAG: hypothetical protein AAF741_03005 [Bacteroidota bacterium]